MVLDVVNALPAIGDAAGGTVAADDVAHAVVHAHLVVEVVEPGLDVGAVLGRVVHLADEVDVGMTQFHNAGGISPELRRHHLSHVAAKSVDALRRPEEQNVGHFAPSAGYGVVVEAATAGIAIVHAVVELHCLVPVVHTGMVVEPVVARAAGGHLHVGLLALGRPHGQHERLAGTIVEIVPGREVHVGAVVLTQVAHAGRACNGVVFAGHVVGHKVDDDLHVGLMGALHQGLEFGHTAGHVDGQVGVDVVIIGDGIGRTGLAFRHRGVLPGNAVAGIVGGGGVTDDASVPDMGESHAPDAAQTHRIEIVHLAHAVLEKRAVLLPGAVRVAKEAWENLINK